MVCFTYENDGLKVHETAALPEDIEILYQQIRKEYSIQFYLADWADDDTDAGWGYDYDNSYGFTREIFRDELVLRDGKLYGFYVNYNGRDIDEKYLLIPGEKEECGENRVFNERYADYMKWELITEETPAPCGYVFLPRVKQEDENHEFTPDEFSEKYIEDVVKKIKVQDTRGHFDDAFRLTLKLTEEGITDPDGVRRALAAHIPILVRE